MGTLRTKQGEATYQKAITEGVLENGCVLCKKKPKKEFEFWNVVKNDFPYDKIAETHDMLVTKRHITEAQLSDEELKELQKIKEEYVHTNYEWMFEATPKKKSVPEHFHIHLMIAKD